MMDAHQAFRMAIDVEERFIDFDTFLSTYESLESCPPWVSVVRLFYCRALEKQEALQEFLHQSMQGAESRRPDA